MGAKNVKNAVYWTYQNIYQDKVHICVPFVVKNLFSKDPVGLPGIWELWVRFLDL